MDAQALEGLAGDIQDVEGQQPEPGQPAPAEGQQVAVMDPLTESRMMWGVVFSVIDGTMPEAAGLYPPDRRESIIAAWPELAAQEGWTVNFLGGKWGMRIMFAALVVPAPIVKALIAMVTDKMSGKRKKVEEQGAAPAAPGGGDGVQQAGAAA